MDDLKNNRASFLGYIKLCALFQIHRGIQTGVTIRKRSIQVKNEILSCVTLKFDGWGWKRIGLLFYVISNSVLHFVSINQFKLELQSRNAKFGWKSTIFFVNVIEHINLLWTYICGHVYLQCLHIYDMYVLNCYVISQQWPISMIYKAL